MSRPANLPAPPLSVASKLGTTPNSSSLPPPSSATQSQQQQQQQQRSGAVQNAIKLPTAPKSVVTGKPLLTINGTRVIIKQILHLPSTASSQGLENNKQQPREVLQEGVIVEHDEGSKTVVVESGTQLISGISTEQTGEDVVTVWTGPSEITDTDDLVAIRQPDTLSVLYCLMQRFFTKLPYTWLTRDSLVYLNPFQKCPDVFAGGQPHPFSVAEQARKLIMEDENDVVAAVLSGQSGSGKTSAAKMILQQFASSLSLSSPSNNNNNVMSLDFVNLISAVNPILESFGNAVTSANSNSSRFIRITRITTDRKCRPLGAEIQASLLETSRLCGLRPAESSFHIFYALLAGLPAKDKIELELTDASLFKSLVANSAFVVSNSAAAAPAGSNQQQHQWLAAAPPFNLGNVADAMKQTGMSQTDVNTTWRMLAFILHILNLEFAGDLQAKVSTATTKSLNTAAKILKVDPAKLEESMTQAKFTDPATQQLISRKFTVSAATASRDTLARNLYQSLFMWIVGKINESLKKKCDEMISIQQQQQQQQNSSLSLSPSIKLRGNPTNNNNNTIASSSSSIPEKVYSLLILDIFGFESMRNVPNAEGVAPPSVTELNCHNGLEQLLINVVNEELQNLFTETSLIGFCDELSREGVSIPTNEMAQAEAMARELSTAQHRTLDALERKAGGILSTINDDSKLGTPSAAAVLQERILALASKQHAGVIKKPKGVPDPEHPSFIVEHFACPVPYSAAGMSAKNRVSIAGLATLIPLVTDPTTLELLRAAESASKKGSGSTTFTALLKEQFSSVIETLRKAKCLWVRCIKPNSTSTPNTFDVRDVKRQLLTAGVLASASVLAQGLSVRLPVKDFALRFACCLDKYPFKDVEGVQFKKISEAIAKKVQLLQSNQKFGVKTTGALALQRQRDNDATNNASAAGSPSSIQIGLTKVFCNADSYDLLVVTSNNKLVQYTVLIQRVGRGMMMTMMNDASTNAAGNNGAISQPASFPGRMYVGELLRQAVRRRIAHELALRMEREKPIRESLEIQRCAIEERSIRQLQRLGPAAKQFKQDATRLGENVKGFLNTMQSELHKVCVDIGLHDRVRKQKEQELEQQEKYAEQIQQKLDSKEQRETRAAALAAFKKVPTHHRLTMKREEEERKRKEAEAAKMKYQIDRAHRDVARTRATAEQQLTRQYAKQHASQQVGWLHQHLRRAWHRLDQQAEIAGNRALQSQAAPGYIQDFEDRLREKRLGIKKSESILISPTFCSSPPPPPDDDDDDDYEYHHQYRGDEVEQQGDSGDDGYY